MFARNLLACVFVAALTVASVASAQDMTNKELTTEVKRLNSLLTQMMENITLQGTAISKQSQVVDRHEEKIKTLTGDLYEQQTRQEQILSDLKDLQNKLQDQLTKQGQILEVISKTDSTGNRIPRLSAIMDKSEEFRQDVTDAVHKAIRPDGRLILTNRTPLPQTVYVNRQPIVVNTGESKTIPVKVGTVTTQVPGRDITNWAVGAPHYEQYVDIVPAPEVPAVPAHYSLY